MYYGFRPYVSVAQRRAKAQAYSKKLLKKGEKLTPLNVTGRTIATTFWGKAWCENLEAYSDFENRLPRGRTYIRNGSVIDLKVTAGTIKALVSGSSIYTVSVKIEQMSKTEWKQLTAKCAGSIDSMVELLQGKFSSSVMKVMTEKKSGLFPSPKKIKMTCSCPDWAVMCKHCAAVLYGIGAKLDNDPQLLFGLRGVAHTDLLNVKAKVGVSKKGRLGKVLAHESVSDIFGIEIEEDSKSAASRLAPLRARSKRRKTEVAPKRI